MVKSSDPKSAPAVQPMKDAKKQWLVFYTKSRQEKKVRELLVKGGFEVFLPLHKVIRQWSDRKKKVEVPLFSSYIFVYEREHNIPAILQTPGIAWNIRLSGKPAVLRQHELELIERFLASGLFLETESIDRNEFREGDKAIVVDGPLAGIAGVVSKSDAGKLIVMIEGIDQVIRVQIPHYLLKKC